MTPSFSGQDVGRQETTVVEVVFEKAREHLRIHAHRNPDFFGTAKSERAFEAARTNTYHCVGRGVQCQNFADDVRVRAQFVHPQGMADDRDVIASRLTVFVREEEPPHHRTQSEDVKIVRAHHLPQHLLGLGFAAPGQGQGTHKRCQPREDLVVPRIVLVIREGHGQLLTFLAVTSCLGVNRVDLDQAGNVFYRQRMQQDRIHNREDRGIGANSQGQRQDRDRAEPSVLGQHPSCIANVLQQSLHRIRRFPNSSSGPHLPVVGTM